MCVLCMSIKLCSLSGTQIEWNVLSCCCQLLLTSRSQFSNQTHPTPYLAFPSTVLKKAEEPIWGRQTASNLLEPPAPLWARATSEGIACISSSSHFSSPLHATAGRVCYFCVRLLTIFLYFPTVHREEFFHSLLLCAIALWLVAFISLFLIKRLGAAARAQLTHSERKNRVERWGKGGATTSNDIIITSLSTSCSWLAAGRLVRSRWGKREALSSIGMEGARRIWPLCMQRKRRSRPRQEPAEARRKGTPTTNKRHHGSINLAIKYILGEIDDTTFGVIISYIYTPAAKTLILSETAFYCC